MLTDFGKIYDKKMRERFNLKLFNFFVICIFLAGCEKRGTVVTFANVCHEENQQRVELKGFLNHSPNNFMTMTYRDFYYQHLLVENENGTGGFIEVLFTDEKVSRTNGEVKVIGKILKDEFSCVLEVEKVEAR